MKINRQLLIALSMIVAGGLTAFALINSPPQTDRQAVIAKLPSARVVKVAMESMRMDVHSQGSVIAHTEIDLVAEVSGHVIKVAPNFVEGGFFKKRDVLIEIDPSDYKLRVTQANAKVMEARYQLVREKAESEQARDEWEHLGQGTPSPLSLRIPQLEEKRAKLAAEVAELENAKLLQSRTSIRAPFDGRVRSKLAGIGQYISSGTVLGRVYSSDLVEIRLPINTSDLAFVEFPDLSDRNQSPKMAKVTLSAFYQGQDRIWQGHIVRSEGIIDKDTGMMAVIAQVRDPFGIEATKSRSPTVKATSVVGLPVGLFVEAIIEGRWVDHLAILPASALIKNSQVAVVDHHNQLQFRTVRVLKREREQVMISAGLNQGENVLVAGIPYPIEGMQVQSIFIDQSSDDAAIRAIENNPDNPNEQSVP